MAYSSIFVALLLLGQEAPSEIQFPCAKLDPQGIDCQRKSFFATSWRSPYDIKEPKQFSHITGFIWVNRTTQASTLRKQLRALPAGRRFVFIEDPSIDDAGDRLNSNAMDACTEDPSYHCLPWTYGTQKLRARFVRQFSEWKNQSIPLDGVIIDFEDPQQSLARQIGAGAYMQDQYRADLQWKQESFKGLKALFGNRPFQALGLPESPQWPAIFDWQHIAEPYISSSLDKAIASPLREYYPRASTSNYFTQYYTPSLELRDGQGHPAFASGRGHHMGTHQAPELYTYLGQWFAYTSGTKIDRTAFNAMRKDIQFVQSSFVSSAVPLSPWIMYPSFAFRPEFKPVYREEIFHIALSSGNLDYFIYWNPYNGLIPYHTPYHRDDTLIENTLEELNQVIGFKKRIPLFKKVMTLSDIENEDFLISQAQVGGSKVTRISFDPLQMINNSYLESTESEEVRFRTPYHTITFEKARVYQSGNASSGFWIIQKPGVSEPHIEKLGETPVRHD